MLKTSPGLTRWLTLLLLPLLAACSKSQTLQALFPKPASPHEAYARSLHRSGLDRTALGAAWLSAADRALRDSLTVTLPFAETGYFRADLPTAASWRYPVRTGEAIQVSVSLAPGTRARLFLDAFELPTAAGTVPQLLASADTASLAFSYVASADRTHLLRLQPELLAAGRYTIRIQRAPSLGFPVSGRTDAAIGSGWGAPRDGGARRHEGIDIFAPLGTPAVAASAGFITRVSETPLGGRVVWLADLEHSQHLYYAHLDRQLVRVGQQVQPGDTLGLVGNTGNARTTTPHLHFGVYRAGHGAVDALPFVRHADTPPADPPAGLSPGEWARIRKKPAKVTSAPTAGPALATLPRHAALRIAGRHGAAYRVELPDGRTGYVAAADVEGAEARPLRRAVPSATAATELRLAPQPSAAPLASLAPGERVAVLAEASAWQLVRTAAGLVGWVAGS